MIMIHKHHGHKTQSLCVKVSFESLGAEIVAASHLVLQLLLRLLSLLHFLLLSWDTRMGTKITTALSSSTLMPLSSKSNHLLGD